MRKRLSIAFACVVMTISLIAGIIVLAPSGKQKDKEVSAAIASRATIQAKINGMSGVVGGIPAGDGLTANTAYQISTAQQFANQNMKDALGMTPDDNGQVFYRITANLNMANAGTWSSVLLLGERVVLSGGMNTISGFTVNAPALFREIAGTIRDVNIQTSYNDSLAEHGAVAREAIGNAFIQNVHVTTTYTQWSKNNVRNAVGGAIVRSVKTGANVTILKSTVTARSSGAQDSVMIGGATPLGGFVGLVEGGAKLTIGGSVNNADIWSNTATVTQIGGFVGYTANGSTVEISDSINKGNIATNGNVSGNSGSSGFIGWADGTVTISNCVNASTIPSANHQFANAFVGSSNSSNVTIENSLANASVSKDQDINKTNSDGSPATTTNQSDINEKQNQIQSIIEGKDPVRITRPNGEGYNFTGAAQVAEGSVYNFTITLQDAYSQTDLTNKVKYGAGNTIINGTRNGNTYSYSIAKLETNITIIVNDDAPLSINTYTITAPMLHAENGWVYVNTNPKTKYEHGETFTFSVTPNEGWNRPTVSQGGTTLSRIGNTENYSFVVAGDRAITVSAPVKTTHGVTLQNATGATLARVTNAPSGNGPWNWGTRYEFTVEMTNTYDLVGLPTASYSGGSVDVFPHETIAGRYFLIIPIGQVTVSVNTQIKNFPITFEQNGSGVFTMPTNTTREHNLRNQEFFVTMASSHNENAPTVQFSYGAATGNLTNTIITATRVGTTDEYGFVVPQIYERNIVTITPQINTYIVAGFVAPAGLTNVTPTAQQNNINWNTAHTFTFRIADSYSQSEGNITVTYTDGGAPKNATVSAAVDGVYTVKIPNITANVSNITFNGIEINKYDSTIGFRAGSIQAGSFSLSHTTNVAHNTIVTVSMTGEAGFGGKNYIPSQVFVNGVPTSISAGASILAGGVYSTVIHTFIITGVTNVEVMFIEDNGTKRTVTHTGSKVGYTTDLLGSQEIFDGQILNFSIALLPEYSQVGTPVVRFNNGVINATSQSGLIWSYSMLITANATVTVDAMTINRYNVNYVNGNVSDAGHTYKVNNVVVSSTQVTHNTAHTFAVDILASHMLQSVIINGQPQNFTNSAIGAKTHSFTIDNVTEIKTVTITSARRTYDVDLVQSVGDYWFSRLSASENNIPYGGSYEFRVHFAQHYNQSAPVVKLIGTAELILKTTFEGGQNAGWLYEVRNIQSAITIEVDAPAKNKYNVNYPTVRTGYALDKTSGLVTWDEEVTFTISLNPTHNQARNFVVRLNSNAVSGIKSGNNYTYTFKVDGNTDITVAVDINQYNVIAPIITGQTQGATISNGTSPVTDTGNYSFTVNLLYGYKIGQVRYKFDGDSDFTTLTVAAGTTYNILNIKNHVIEIEVIIAKEIYSVSGGIGVAFAGSNQVAFEESKIFTITAPANQFISRILVNGVSLGESSSWVFGRVTLLETTITETITRDTTVTAEFLPIPMTTMSFSDNFGTNPSVRQSIAGQVGAPFTGITEPVRFGYEFMGWATSENGTVVNIYTFTQNTTYFAVWEIVNYNIEVVQSTNVAGVEGHAMAPLFNVEQTSNWITVTGTLNAGDVVEWSTSKGGIFAYGVSVNLSNLISKDFYDAHAVGNKFTFVAEVKQNVFLHTINTTVIGTAQGQVLLNGTDLIRNKVFEVPGSAINFEVNADHYYRYVIKVNGIDVTNGTHMYSIPASISERKTINIEIEFIAIQYNVNLVANNNGTTWSLGQSSLKVDSMLIIQTDRNVIHNGASYRFGGYRIQDLSSNFQVFGNGTNVLLIPVTKSFLDTYMGASNSGIAITVDFDRMFAINVTSTGEGNVSFMERVQDGFDHRFVRVNTSREVLFVSGSYLRLNASPDISSTMEIKVNGGIVDWASFDWINLNQDLNIIVTFTKRNFVLYAQGRYENTTIVSPQRILENNIHQVGSTVVLVSSMLSAPEGYKFVKWQTLRKDGQYIDVKGDIIGSGLFSVTLDVSFVDGFSIDGVVTFVAVYSMKNELRVTVSAGKSNSGNDYEIWIGEVKQEKSRIEYGIGDLLVIKPIIADNFDFIGYEINGERADWSGELELEIDKLTMLTLIFKAKIYELAIAQKGSAGGKLVYSDSTTFQVSDTIVISFSTSGVNVMDKMIIGGVNVNQLKSISGVRFNGETLTIVVSGEFITFAHSKGWISEDGKRMVLDIEVSTVVSPLVVGGGVATGIAVVAGVVAMIFFIISIRKKKADLKIAMEKFKASNARMSASSVIGDVLKQAKGGDEQ